MKSLTSLCRHICSLDSADQPATKDITKYGRGKVQILLEGHKNNLSRNKKSSVQILRPKQLKESSTKVE